MSALKKICGMALLLSGAAVPLAADEPATSRLAVRIDNDNFAQGRDADYTGGGSVSLARRTGVSWQFGVSVYTPEDIESSHPIVDDRPYANLVFVSRSRDTLSPSERRSHRWSWTLGLLGTEVGGWLQTRIHEVVGATRPGGYDHQISDGGELTGRLTFDQLHLIGRSRRHQMMVQFGGALGYTTEASAAFGFRLGRIESPWHTAREEFGLFVEDPAVFRPRHRRERYLFGGVRLRGRAYNALLQGQFRESEVRFVASQVSPILIDGWMGLATGLWGMDLNYVLRYQSAEIRHGTGARNLLWGGLTFSKAL